MPPPSAETILNKARRALDAARLLMADADTEGTCNRAYYAMFYAAHAALWGQHSQPVGVIVKTHTGLMSLVAQHLVKPGVMDAEQGRALANVQKIRLLADYTDEPPSVQDAADALARAEAFVQAIASLRP